MSRSEKMLEILASSRKALQESYLHAETLILDRLNVDELKEHLVIVNTHYKTLLEFLEGLSDEDVIPGTPSKKVDYQQNKKELDERVSHWLKEATQDVPGVSKRSSKGVPSVSERSSKRGSKTRCIEATELRSVSVSSSVRSEVLRSKVKLRLARLAAEQEEAKLLETSERVRREALERAEKTMKTPGEYS